MELSPITPRDPMESLLHKKTMIEENADKYAATIESTRKLLLAMAKAVVRHENDVEVEVVKGESRVFFVLKLDPHDRGKIIGKQGHTVRALRNIVASIGLRYRYHFELDIRG